MIFDAIENIDRYLGLYPNLDIAIDFIQHNDLSQLKKGKNIVKGEEVYVNVVDAMMMTEEDAIYELHKRYLDLHIDIEGSENMLFSAWNEENVTSQYTLEDDNALLKGNMISRCHLDGKHFAICMLDEPHMPCIIDDGIEAETIRKAIFKIKV